MTEQFANNATTTLNGSITNVQTSLVVSSATTFPTSPQFRIIIDSEIMLVTGVSGTTFTVTRGIENTTAAAHNSGATVSMILTAGALDQLRSDLLPIETIGHRLTVSSGTPITTSDVTGAGTIYLTPFRSSRIPLFNGTVWKQYSVPEISLSLSGIVSGKNYDVFAYDNNGTVTLELSNAWTTDTSRADAITTQDGVKVKSANLTRRLVGTIRASANNVVEDSNLRRFVWNMYNQVSKFLLVTETTASWTYQNNVWRAVNNNTANSFEYISGDFAKIAIRSFNMTQTSTSNTAATGIGIDSTTVNSANLFGGTSGTSGTNDHMAHFNGYLSIGYHKITWIELSTTTTQATFFAGGSQTSFGVPGMYADLAG